MRTALAHAHAVPATVLVRLAALLVAASVLLSPLSAHAESDLAPSTLSSVSATPAAAPGASRLLVGVNDHPLAGPTPADAPTMLDHLTQVGAGLVRIDVHWSWLEWAGPGRARWNADQLRLLDAYLNAASQRGVAVQVTVLGTPCWAAAGGPRDCSSSQAREAAQTIPPRNPQDLAAFLRELARFAAGRVKYIGVGNEPNHPAFWAQPDPAAYTHLLRAAYPAIKSVDPTVAVVAGALAPGNPQGARLSTIDFLHGMYAASARGSFDYLEYHPYSDGHAPDWFDPSWPLYSFQHSVPAVRAEMLANGDDRPIILGEFGWTTIDNRVCSDCGGVKLGVSSQQQADYLAQALQIAQAWPFVHSMLVYELADRGPATSTASIDHFGIFDRGLHAKPAAAALLGQVQALNQTQAPTQAQTQGSGDQQS